MEQQCEMDRAWTYIQSSVWQRLTPSPPLSKSHTPRAHPHRLMNIFDLLKSRLINIRLNVHKYHVIFYDSYFSLNYISNSNGRFFSFFSHAQCLRFHTQNPYNMAQFFSFIPHWYIHLRKPRENMKSEIEYLWWEEWRDKQAISRENKMKRERERKNAKKKIKTKQRKHYLTLGNHIPIC